MLNKQIVQAWEKRLHWESTSLDQVEQDLILERVIVEIGNHPHLKDVVVFSGGTTLHKVLLPVAQRYSEDIDFLTTTDDKEVVSQVMMDIRTIMSGITGRNLKRMRPKGSKTFPGIRAPYPGVTGVDKLLKLECAPHRAQTISSNYVLRKFSTKSDWFQGSATIKCVTPEFLAATKVSALFKRSKGRDLYDLVQLITTLNIDASKVGELLVEIEAKDQKVLRRVKGTKLWNTAYAKQQLRDILSDVAFVRDLVNLVPTWTDTDMQEAVVVFDELVEAIGSHIGRLEP